MVQTNEEEEELLKQNIWYYARFNARVPAVAHLMTLFKTLNFNWLMHVSNILNSISMLFQSIMNR